MEERKTQRNTKGTRNDGEIKRIGRKAERIS
jgi:hypothetical protein